MKMVVARLSLLVCMTVLAVDVTDTWKVQALKDFTARSPMTQLFWGRRGDGGAKRISSNRLLCPAEPVSAPSVVKNSDAPPFA